ncbi:MAG: phosphate transport system protein [Chloroflexota bacterium]|jgi:phosphate transport system protein|nr:phosphate transport system protein [Chloroflexota bacterium]
MIRRHFEEELDEVRTIASRMAALVEDAIRLSMQSLLKRDRDLANLVVEGDKEINRLHMQLREEVFTIISTQAPVASDLRLVIGVGYIGAELERMGDYATRIAKRSRRLADEPEGSPAVYVELGQMAELVEQQVHDILDAFIAVDQAAAMAVAERDDRIDRLYRKVFADQISAMTEDPEHALRTQYLLNIAHTLERLADRVTNVAEDIVFLATGDVVELD